jgi:DNA-binding MarR family transcriptional regulator
MDIEWMGRVCLAHAARRTANLVTRHYNRYLAPLGLEVTQAVLLGVIGSGRADSLSALARLMGIERSTLQRNLHPLEQAGLVRRNRKGPKRVVPELTPQGEEKLAEAYDAWQQAQTSLTDALDDPDADAIRAHLSALRKAVHRIEAVSPVE